MLIVEDGVKGAFKTKFYDYESIRPDEQLLCDKHGPSVFYFVRIGPYTIAPEAPEQTASVRADG